MKKGPSLFSQKVWELAASIPRGQVTTYGHIARAAGGGSQAARSITHILTKAPDILKIPFHRIVYAHGKIWLSPAHEKKRKQLYKKEKIDIDENGRVKNFREILYTFD